MVTWSCGDEYSTVIGLFGSPGMIAPEMAAVASGFTVAGTIRPIVPGPPVTRARMVSAPTVMKCCPGEWFGENALPIPLLWRVGITITSRTTIGISA